jgi:integrase
MNIAVKSKFIRSGHGRGLAKQAKTLTDRQIKRVLTEVATHRYPERDRVMVLLSVKAGLRAKEIAMVTWVMVTDAEGNVGDALHLLNGASKGKKGGRTVPLNSELHDALLALKAKRNGVEPLRARYRDVAGRCAGVVPPALQREAWLGRRIQA